MSEEILINITPQETRVAVIENGVLQEVYVERERKRGIVGNIYKGKVCRVLPGMQAAFVEIGLARAAFIHASDIWSGERATESEVAPEKAEVLPIMDLVSDGQEILVQVIKDPLGSKGARLTTHITIPARFLVYMPMSSHIGVSQKIEDEAERERLISLVTRLRAENGGSGGYIVRTVAEGADEAALLSDIKFLNKVWSAILEKKPEVSTASLLHEDLPLSMRAIRDMVSSDVEKVRIDSKEYFHKAQKFVSRFIPEMAVGIDYYSGPRPIFDLYSVEDEIQKALESKVQLKSGGHLVIDQTEAMTTVDVNTGAFVGHRNLEETIFKTNLEATVAIARQLRLRNLGGIIIIDFIDMESEDHKAQVLRSLERGLEKDHAKSHVSEVSSLGLVQMTRKRTRESLGHILCEPCPVCRGQGSVKTPETIAFEIFREITREARQFEAQTFLVLASQEVVDLMTDEESAGVAELEAFIGRPIKFQVEAQYSQELYDVVLM